MEVQVTEDLDAQSHGHYSEVPPGCHLPGEELLLLVIGFAIGATILHYGR